jgi:hypothetical protein
MKDGRPVLFIDLEELKRIMSFYPTLDEVASWFTCSPDSVERRVKEEWGLTFKDFRERCSGKTRLLLKRKAISKALEEDNEKMLIYCLRTMTDLDDRGTTENQTQENGILRLAYSVSKFTEEEMRL